MRRLIMDMLISSSRCLVAFAAISCAVLQAEKPAPTWSDEFAQPDNSAPDPAKWTFDVGGGGWGNKELETYTTARENCFIASDPAAQDGKVLVIKAVKLPNGSYTSARLKTQGKFSARYGRIEARIRNANGKGLWSAFWLLGDRLTDVGWPACGEIDIMEILGARPTKAFGTMHGPGYSGDHGIGASYTLPYGATYDAAFHIFAVDWSPEKVVWSVDDVPFHTVTPATLPAGTRWVFQETSFFLLLNLAVGGRWPGNPDETTAFPQTMVVDYVRVYALAPTASTPSAAARAK